MADQYNIPLQEVINKVRSMTQLSSPQNELARTYSLDIVDICWEDNARNKNSVWGPCISDMTLQVGKHRMPVLREPNYQDKTWDVPIESIPIVIGNECDSEGNKQNLQTISLKTYLSNLNEYITNNNIKNKKIDLLRKNNKDKHVIMSSQCCFLPIEKGKQTKFGVAIYNYQSRENNPAVLVIVSTSKGTSAQIIKGNEQLLLFNQSGRKAEFIAQRLTDNRKEKGIAVKGAMSKEEKQENMIVLIQIPLLQRKEKTMSNAQAQNQPAAPFKGFFNFGGKESGHNEMMDDYKKLKTRSIDFKNVHQNDDGKSNVEAAIIKIAPKLHPECICGAELKKYQVQYAYGDDKVPVIVCDVCSKSMSKNTEIVWHCPLGKKQKTYHKNGYDLCQKCGETQLAFAEFDGLKPSYEIRRNEDFAIRVTLQYYKSTDNGIVDSNTMFSIKEMLSQSQKNADFIGSLVVDDDAKERDTFPIAKVKDDNKIANAGYQKIFEWLQKNGGKEWQKYYENFLNEEVNDFDILNLTNEDLLELIDKMGPRNRCKQWIEERKKLENPNDVFKDLL